ncbi:hypothetical protein C4556_00760 [Candidatus Parcubacteria bacterium]|nr:MAG: hypothetical protein C4556_00760 [Candidatus Parcubacteria bacterium]
MNFSDRPGGGPLMAVVDAGVELLAEVAAKFADENKLPRRMVLVQVQTRLTAALGTKIRENADAQN